ncbi:MAG: M23 family metallopeptidase [Planctomycetes bacterium]|nr:M23 family metallopeptidase [Planctomycetota bacterium]
MERLPAGASEERAGRKRISLGLAALLLGLFGGIAVAGERSGTDGKGNAGAAPAAGTATAESAPTTPPKPLYCLPWPGSVPHPCYQGNFGKATHLSGQQNNYAWDFGMNLGEPVTTARAGKVVHVDDKGGKEGDKENTIRVLHEDRTYGVYAHLKTGSAKVQVGDFVEAGELLASSGDMHHLHFVVWDAPTMKSIPAAFFEVKENAGVPQEKRTYKSAAPRVAPESVRAAAALLDRADGDRAKGRLDAALRAYLAITKATTGVGGNPRERARHAVDELTQAGLEQVTAASAKASSGDAPGARKALDAIVRNYRGTDAESAAKRELAALSKAR